MGVNFDVFCTTNVNSRGSVTVSNTSTYNIWCEWFPNSEVDVINMPVSAGDEVFTEVWHTSPTQGVAFIVN